MNKVHKPPGVGLGINNITTNVNESVHFNK